MPRFHSDPAAKHMLFRTRQRVVMPTWRHTSVLYVPCCHLRATSSDVEVREDRLR